jgi:hypothetical protein
MNRILPYTGILADLWFNHLIVNNIINPNIIKYYNSEYMHVILSVNIAFAIFIPFMKFLKPSYTDMYSLIIAISMIVQYYDTYYIILYGTLLFIAYPFWKQINEDIRININTTIMLIYIRYTMLIYAITKLLRLNI